MLAKLHEGGGGDALRWRVGKQVAHLVAPLGYPVEASGRNFAGDGVHHLAFGPIEGVGHLLADVINGASRWDELPQDGEIDSERGDVIFVVGRIALVCPPG